MRIENHSRHFFDTWAPSLLSVENPGRYAGGEWGECIKEEADLRFCMAFPDLYEIGMSNQAMKILYNRLNADPGVYCERVFCPAPDYEEYLKGNSLALHTLETKTPVNQMDIIGFTFGYEMGFTGVLTMLASGGIPLDAKDRSDRDPLVIMGGPAASNPLPYARFIDCVWLGEAEDAWFELMQRLSVLKKAGADRKILYEEMIKSPHMWAPGKKAVRSVDGNFSTRPGRAAVLPVPNIKIIQDHGAVEIMRGCPNGCRFCHAGVWYKPMRQKEIPVIREEVAQFIREGGYREITLSSLSSGDYEYIDSLVDCLTNEYEERKISFQLPSLRVSTFTLSIMEQLSRVRKSGLTFAIETPFEMAQFCINKEVKKEQVISIIREAKNRGWRQAKFYFMIGLPVNLPEGRLEEVEIVDYIKSVHRSCRFTLNVNVGCFVPKPHTPFQWAGQIDEQLAYQKMLHIRRELKPLGIKVNTHNTFVSMLEGILARGDERVGDLILAAWQEGCRLDAWEDHIKKDVWERLVSERKQLCDEILGPRSTDRPLPWDSVQSGVKSSSLLAEYRASLNQKLSPVCSEECTSNCGVCAPVGSEKIAKNKTILPLVKKADPTVEKADPFHTGRQPDKTWRMLFSFTKTGPLIFTPHLALVELLSKAFVRAAMPVQYTEGFNPLPRLEFASPLAMGIEALGEIAQVEMASPISSERFLASMNASLPSGIRILEAWLYVIPLGTKKISASACLDSFIYRDANGEPVQVPFKDDKAWRLENKDRIPVREGLMARAQTGGGSPVTYFKFFKSVYGE